MDEIDRRAAKLIAESQEEVAQWQNNHQTAQEDLSAVVAIMRQILSQKTSRTLSFLPDELTGRVYTLSVFVKSEDETNQQDILVLESRPSDAEKTPYIGTSFSETNMDSFTFDEAGPDQFNEIAEEYVEIFLDVVARMVADGEEVI